MRPDEARFSYSQRHPTIYNNPDCDYYIDSLWDYRQQVDELREEIMSFPRPQRPVAELESEIVRLQAIVEMLRSKLRSLKEGVGL